MKEIHNVVIVGMGALGLMFGHRMQENLGDGRLFFLMDEDRKKRHEKDVYTINGAAVPFCLATPGELREKSLTPDMVIVATKYDGLEAARSLVRSVIDENTIIISLLNGITSEEILAEALPENQILDCVAICMDAMRDGSDLVYTQMGQLQIGMFRDGQEKELQALAAFFENTKIPYEVCDDIKRRMWNKFMLNVGINQTCMLYDTTYSAALSPGPLLDEMSQAMHEVITVAAAEGITLTEEDFQTDLAILRKLKPDGYPSMRQDALAGRKTEVELFAGTVVKLAEKHGISVPVNASYYKRIREKEEGLEKKTPSVDLNALAEDYLINGIEDFVEIMQDCREIWREKGPLADMPPEDFAQEVYKAMEKIPEERREYLLDFGL